MSSSKWKEVKLGDISKYSKERINVEDLTLDNYISTENMLPQKSGKTIASSLPGGNAIKYKKGQTLVSNIRPYFKKIWYANVDGGCSADVLAFEISENVDAKYFYYLLSQDIFFEYVMAGSKGTKMPRGDKQQILMYPLLLPEILEQRTIADTLSCLDEKIAQNKEINDNLVQQAKAIFKSWFIDFEPYSSCEFVKTLHGSIPKGWTAGDLGDVITLYDSKRVPLSGNIRGKMDKIYPYYGAASLMDYVDNYLFDGVYLLLGEDGTVIDESGYPVLQYVWGKFWVNNHAHILQGTNGFIVESLYLLLKQTNIRQAVTGAVQLKVNQANLRAIPVIIPPEEELQKYNELVTPIFATIRKNAEENLVLVSLRDGLLPKLMAGDIDVSEVNI